MSENNQVDDAKMRAMMLEKALEEGIDFKTIEDGMEIKTYRIPTDLKVDPHEHPTQDEIFYCIKGNGIGIVDDKEYSFSPGESFIAPAGSIHSLRTEETLYIIAVLIPVNRIICHCKQVSYIDIRKAMVQGARTVKDIQEMTGAGTGCGNCIKDIEKIVSMACGCKMVTVANVVKVVKDGASTVEEVQSITGAGSDCGNCKMLLQNIIDTKR